MDRRKASLYLLSALLMVPLASAFGAEQQGAAPHQGVDKDDSPEAKMARRFPQKVRVGDLIGLPVLDDDDVTLGRVQKVVRTQEGKIRLIVSYSKWFGWFGRPVAVPIEVVTILGRQIDSLDMRPKEYEAAPTWSQGQDQTIRDDEIIRIALGRR
ncbi:MAG TPA: PRC-barrel domain-containing protein [Candidatus Binatia bacterium]